MTRYTGSSCACGCGNVTITGLYKPGHNKRRPFDLSRYAIEDRGFGSPCWIWQGNITSTGYGQTHYKGKPSKPHRVFYQEMVGPIGDGLTIDHLCRQKDCVNPTHLEPVTAAENLRRQFRSGSGSPAINASLTHCKHGHELSGSNVYHPPKNPTHRQCRICRANIARFFRERRAA